MRYKTLTIIKQKSGKFVKNPCNYCGDGVVSTATDSSSKRYEDCDGNPTTAQLCQGETKEYYYSKSSLSSNPSDMTCSNCQKTGHCYSYCGDGTKDGSLDEYTNILVALDLDEGSGSTTENTGTLGGSYSISGGGSWATSGKYGKAYNFNGSDTIISTNATKYADSFTMMAWVKVTSGSTIDLSFSQSSSGTNGTSGQHYVFGANQEGSNAGAGLSVGTNGIFVTAHGDNYMPPLAVYSGSLGATWHHVAVVFENKTPKIYLDGTLVKTGSQSSRTTYSPTQVGGGSYGYFNGTLDDVRIIGKSLDATQIKAFMDRSGAESCDSGSSNSDSYGYHCNAHCTGYAPYCGDGVVNGSEQCDGNSTDCSNVGDYNQGSASCTDSCTWNTGKCSKSSSSGC